MFLSGINKRTFSMISSRVIYWEFSPKKINSEKMKLVKEVVNWKKKDLSKESIKYLFIDGTCFSMRVSRSMKTMLVLVVIGVAEKGEKQVLVLQDGRKELPSKILQVSRIFLEKVSQ